MLSGELTIFDGQRWAGFGPGDFVHVADGGVHAFRNDGEDPAAFLILFAPGIARERFFLELAEIRRQRARAEPRRSGWSSTPGTTRSTSEPAR